MTIYVKHNNEIKSAIPYVKYNDNAVVPRSGWAKTGGELKQIWPPTSGDTIYIYDQATLEAFRDRVNAGELSLNALVIADITLTGEWTPIADYTNDSSLQYTGTFDGGGHTITGLTISSFSYYVGFFGYIGSLGIVKSVKLANVSITQGSYAGGIAGLNDGTVRNCICSGAITTTDSNQFSLNAGGIVGYNRSGTVIYNTNTATVAATDNAGGIVGNNRSGTVSNNTNTGSVSSGSHAGGIVGSTNSGTVTGNTNTGTVTGINITTLA